MDCCIFLFFPLVLVIAVYLFWQVFELLFGAGEKQEENRSFQEAVQEMRELEEQYSLELLPHLLIVIERIASVQINTVLDAERFNNEDLRFHEEAVQEYRHNRSLLKPAQEIHILVAECTYLLKRVEQIVREQLPADYLRVLWTVLAFEEQFAWNINMNERAFREHLSELAALCKALENVTAAQVSLVKEREAELRRRDL